MNANPDRSVSGVDAAQGRARVQRIAVALICFVWLTVFLVLGVAGGEWWLAVRERNKEEGYRRSRPKLAAIEEAYRPFRDLDINPLYFSFFTFDLSRRASENSAVCHVDGRGFRGPGPEQAAGRKLAFLLGGSAAFGYLCSSDDTTITGWLNRQQEEFFFVNAGVPYWNSTQELFRLTRDLLEHHPALIVTYDGANDLEVASRYAQTGHPENFAPGTPGGFEAVYERIGKAAVRRGMIERTARAIVPRLTECLYSREEAEARDADPGFIDATARSYVANLERIRVVAEAHGARHVAVFQPMRVLHDRLPEKLRRNKPERGHAEPYRAAALEMGRKVGLHDFSNLFDRHFDEVPCLAKPARKDLTEDMIFIDGVHLYDNGNRLVAEEIIALLSGSSNRSR